MNKDSDSAFGILGHFLKWEQTTPDAVFLRQPRGNDWKEYTWREAGMEARKILARLQQLQYKPGAKISIWSQNCAEWIICDLAIMMGGYVSVPFYANVNADTLRGILLHAESSLLFAGKLKDKDWENAKSAIPETVKTVAMSGYDLDSVTSWNEFMGSDNAEGTIVLPQPDDLLTIIYTSGTTGTPKGVMHSHGTIINAVVAASEMVLLNQRGNRFLSYLPLSHAAERGLVEFGAIYCGGTISFVESVESFSRTIQNVLPTHFLGVPRVWQKFKEKIHEQLSQKKLDLLLALPVISSWLKRRIKSSLGLQKALLVFTGAAPITVDLLKWFDKLGIHIQEGYGLSEDFNVCSLNPKEDIRIGTVGKLIPNQDVKILPDTHEIVQRSDWIMKGYYKEPELNAAAMQNGYLHTGDMGEIADGYLTITGRVKDIFKTTKGEYVAPFTAETHFLSMNEVDQACVLGTRFPQPFIVVVLSKPGKEMSRSHIEQRLKAAIELCNENSMGYQKLKKVIVVSDEWTNENNLLTPTLKVKRNVISKYYEEKLEKIYHSEEIVSWESIE